MELQNLNNGNKELIVPNQNGLSDVVIDERKIKFCSEEQIKQSLRYIFILIGCSEKDLPNDIEKTVLISFIMEAYSMKYTAEELKTAFKYAVEGKFVVDLELYGKRFNSLYLSRIMRAYDDYKASQRKPSAKLPIVAAESQTEWSDESKIECFNFNFEYWLEKKQLPIAFPSDVVLEVLKTKGVDVDSLLIEAELESLTNLRAYNELSQITKRFGYDEVKLLDLRRNILGESNKKYHRSRILTELGFEKYKQLL